MLCLRDSNSTPAPSGIMVRRSALEAVGGFVGEADNLYDDQSFYFKFGLRYVVLTAGACWYKYRLHPNSCCAVASRDGRHTQARLAFLEWASRELDSSGLDRPDLRHALQNEIARHPPRSRYKQVLSSIPGVRSTWHLMRAVKDAWADDSAVSVLEVQQDFSSPDPWSYTTNDLEKVRHCGEAHMLDAVRGQNRFGRALEIGCAEGIFTELLAERCDSLLAADFSEPALARARQRCHWNGRVTFERLDLRNDPLPGVFDLIVAIHVLEYIRNPVTLRKVRERLVKGLRPGGYLLIGSCSIQDLKERAWWSRYMLRGGRRVNDFFAGHRKLSVVDSAVYPLPGSESHDLLFRKAQ
jgi:SAM-dependent methyltransferase